MLPNYRLRLGAVAQILLSNDSIPVERSLAQPEDRIAANRPNLAFAQTFGGLIPNCAQPASSSAVVSSSRTVAPAGDVPDSSM
jgi:hypothetical protein